MARPKVDNPATERVNVAVTPEQSDMIAQFVSYVSFVEKRAVKPGELFVKLINESPLKAKMDALLAE